MRTCVSSFGIIPQQYHGYRKGTFVSPDNPANESTGMLIYDLFCKEWTTAPENTRMAKLFALDTRYERQEDYDRLLQWFHYESYILPESARELSDFAHDRWKEQPDLNQEQLNNLLVNSHGMMAYTSKTSLLGLTSPQWLAKILPAEHPDHAVFQNTADESVATLPDDMLEENRQQYETFRKAAGDKLLLYFDKTEDAQTFYHGDFRPYPRRELPSSRGLARQEAGDLRHARGRRPSHYP